MTAWLTIIEAGQVPYHKACAGNKAAIALVGLLARNNKTIIKCNYGSLCNIGFDSTNLMLHARRAIHYNCALFAI